MESLTERISTTIKVKMVEEQVKDRNAQRAPSGTGALFLNQCHLPSSISTTAMLTVELLLLRYQIIWMVLTSTQTEKLKARKLLCIVLCYNTAETQPTAKTQQLPLMLVLNITI